MNESEVLKEFEQAEAILKGHFILSSGMHSDTYLQCARVLMSPSRAEKLCSALAAKVKNEIKDEIDLVFAPAMGGVIVGYEMGRQLNKDTIFCERVDGKFEIRRGFNIKPGDKVLIVEDVVTTGKSSLEAIECAKEAGAEILGEACLINRSGQKNPIDIPLISLANLEVKTFSADNVPDELSDIDAVKPGSRWLQK